MFRLSCLCAFATLALSVTACDKKAPAAEAPKPEAAKPEAAPQPETPTPPPAPATPTTLPAPATAAHVMTDPCPAAGEDAAACPTVQAKVDDNIKIAHVLVGWQGSLPGKSVTRTKDEAKKLAIELAHEARKPGADFIALVWKHSDDNGPGVYDLGVAMRGRYVPAFTAMGTSLGEGQVDIAETRFGYHVMKRVPYNFVAPEKPLQAVMTDACPAAGEDPTTCPTVQTPKPTNAVVSHILIGYKGSLPGEAVTRTKEEAKAKAIEIAHAARKKGADFAKLMKANSQDPGPGTYPVSPEAALVPPFKQLSLTLGKGQLDVVETSFGYHVIKRNE